MAELVEALVDLLPLVEKQGDGFLSEFFCLIERGHIAPYEGGWVAGEVSLFTLLLKLFSHTNIWRNRQQPLIRLPSGTC